MKTLTQYIAACIADGKTKTPAKITLDDALLAPLRNLRGQSESKVLEHGHNFFWKNNDLELGPRTVGTYSQPNLDSTKAHKDDTYIGDIHSHPYKIKMGKDARIGPSLGDIDDYYKYKPRKFPLGVNMVMSSASVFLIVVRPISKKSDDVMPDTLALTDYAYETPGLMEALDKAKSKGGLQRWKDEKETWEQFAPEAAAKFTAANREMNIAIANKSKHELYYCADIEASKELVLVSKAVY